jgi:hypothetical protein
MFKDVEPEELGFKIGVLLGVVFLSPVLLLALALELITE